MARSPTTGVGANGQAATGQQGKATVGRVITRAMLLNAAIGVARIAAVRGRKPGDQANYLGYQVPILRRLVMTKHNALKLPRQVGKTWLASFIAVAYLAAGIDVIVAYPTLQQGWLLLLSKIGDICRILGMPMHRCSSQGIECANGACVYVVTTNDIAKSNRGYTGGLLIIDESQDVDATALQKLMPSLKVYKRMNLDVAIFMGTGGARSKLLETCWRERGFNLTHLMPAEIIAADPGYAATDAEFREIMSVEGYRLEQECGLLEGGNAAILKNMKDPLPERYNNPDCMWYDTVGIDIGQRQDATVVTQLRYYPGTLPRFNVVRTLRMDDRYDVQCKLIKNWVYDHGLQRCPIGVEVNGVGRPIYDFLCQRTIADSDPMMNVFPFVCSERSKSGLIQMIQHHDYNHALHVTDPAAYNALDGLVEIFSDDGKTKYDHSDYLSSLIVAFVRAGHVPPLPGQELRSA